MAKNVLSQKKRVTHIKNISDNQYNDEGEMQSESFDYVYDIMRGMDSMKSIDYSPSDDQLKGELLNLTNDEHAQNPPASSSTDCSQAVKTDVKKFQKFSITRKFPLMEKSQKILKQLKHNRSIPKPRAHLASLDVFPAEELSNTYKSSNHSKKELGHKRVITNKEKKMVKTRNSTPVKTKHLMPVKTKDLIQVATNTLVNKSKPVLTATDISRKNKELCIIKNRDNDQNLKKQTNRCELPDKYMDARQRVKTDCNVNDIFSSKNTQSDELSDVNTTDSEYERFILNNKVESEDEIPEKPMKKHSKKKKVSQKKKSHLKKKLQKSFPLESPDEHDSNCFDDLSHHDSSDEGGKFEEEIPKKSNKKHSKKKKISPKKRSYLKKKVQESFSLESPNEHDSNRLSHLSNHYSSDDGGEFEEEIPKESNKKHSKNKKVIQKIKSHQKMKSQKSFPLESAADTHGSSHLHLSDCGDEKEPKKVERSISMESLVEHFDSNCYNDSSSDEGGETDKKIESTAIKSNVSINEDVEAVNNLLLSFNKDVNKSDFSSEEECPTLVEDSNCLAPLKPGTMINETSMNYTRNNSQGLQNTDSNLCNPSASKCLPVSSKVNKCDKPPVENLVINLSSSDSEQETADSHQLTAQKENFEKLKEAQSFASTNADSEESDIEVIEVVTVSNRNKPATTCSVSATSSDNLNRMAAENSNNYKMHGNEIKFSQTHTFENIAQKVNEKLVKKEPKIVESNNPVYMTGMCKEYDENEIISKLYSAPLGSSTAVFNKFKQEKCETVLCKKNTFDDKADDIMVIEPPVNHMKQEVLDDDIIELPIIHHGVKQEVLDDDIIIESPIHHGVKQEILDDVIIDFVTVKKEQSLESTVTHSVSSKRKSEICIGGLESNIKSDCPISCKMSKISNIIDNTSVGKELPIMDCSVTKSLIEQNFSSDPLTASKVLPLLELYKKEFIMYQEIVRTEENVEAGLKMVEAHQAEKLKCIRALIQNLVKNHPCFDKIYSDPVKTKEQDSLQGSVQLNSFQNSPVDKFQSSSSKNFGEVSCRNSQDSSDSSSKVTSSFPSVHIKTENEEKPVSSADSVSVDISHSAARIKTEPGTSGISQASLLSRDVPEDKQALKLLGKKCDVCGKDAVAACQRCAKAFFCSNECGKKFWNDGHERVCDKYV